MPCISGDADASAAHDPVGSRPDASATVEQQPADVPAPASIPPIRSEHPTAPEAPKRPRRSKRSRSDKTALASARPRPEAGPKREPRSAVDRRLLVALVVVAVPAAVTWMLARDTGGDAGREASTLVETVPTMEELADTEPGPVDPTVPAVLDEPEDGDLVGVWQDPGDAGDSGDAGGQLDGAPGPGNSRDVAAPAAPVAPLDAAVAGTEPDPSGDAVAVAPPVEPETPAETTPEAAVDPTEPEPGEVVDDPVVADDGRRVSIETRVEPCKFSSRCLKAGFTLDGFDTLPQEFVCEFSSGSRFTFDLPSSSVGFACATGKVGDSITIEVDGVRSETIVHV